MTADADSCRTTFGEAIAFDDCTDNVVCPDTMPDPDDPDNNVLTLCGCYIDPDACVGVVCADCCAGIPGACPTAVVVCCYTDGVIQTFYPECCFCA